MQRGTPRMKERPIYNDRLALSDDYFATITARMTPQVAGAPELAMPTLRSPNFNCLGSDSCYFPNT